MRVFFTWFVLLIIISVLLSSCSAKSDGNSSESTDNSSTEDISISSSPSGTSSNNTNVALGQKFEYQVTTTGTYSGTLTYSLSNHPEGMTISSSGLIEWTPTESEQIKIYSDITITITTSSAYVFTQTFDLTVNASSAPSISGGNYHSCAMLDNGSVKCWGYNNWGQLGIDNTDNMGDNASEMAQLTGINLGTGRTAKFISAGFAHTCAVLDNGSAKCWGQMGYGQGGIDYSNSMGDNSGEMAQLIGINLGAGRTATAISAGFYHTCALLDNASVKCFGRNNYGQLGIDSTTNMGNNSGEMDQLTGINLGTGRTATAISVGEEHTCVVLDNASVKCWGRNDYGQLGIESTSNKGGSSGDMVSLSSFNLGTGRTVKSITSGSSHNCALLDNGAVKCWGRNSSGQLGIDSMDNKGDDSGEMASLSSINLGTGRTAISISAGYYHTCALLDNGAVKCWGFNGNGQLGIETNSNTGDSSGEMASLSSVNLGTGRIATAIAAGYYHSCAKLDDGAVKCWGRNNYGQLGIGNTTDMGDDAGEMASVPSVNL